MSQPSPWQNALNSSNMMRSSPIAIVRNPNLTPVPLDEDSDDDDSMMDVDRHGRLRGLQQDRWMVGSLPVTTTSNIEQRLSSSLSSWKVTTKPEKMAYSQPAAPRLNARCAQDHETNYMPPISLTSGSTSPSPPSYGSLRESHLAGRFMDGPSSYRDVSSGQILYRRDVGRRQNHQNSSTSGGPTLPLHVTFATPAPLPKEDSNHDSFTSESSSLDEFHPRAKSTLSTLLSDHPPSLDFLPLENRSYSLPMPPPSNSLLTPLASFDEDHDVLMMSMSLTALEILQEGKQLRQQQPQLTLLQHSIDQLSVANYTCSPWWMGFTTTSTSPVNDNAELDAAQLRISASTSLQQDTEGIPPSTHPDSMECFHLDME